MSDKTLYTIIVHSENIAGLLNQVTAVFTRRQINIESLNVSASSIKGVHKYTITAWTDKDIIEKVVKQIEKKIDVIQAHYFTEDEIYFHEIALYKVSTPAFQENPEASKLIRRYNALGGTGKIWDLFHLFGKRIETDGKEELSVLPEYYEALIEITPQIREQLIESEEYDEKRPGDDPSQIFQIREYREGDRILLKNWPNMQAFRYGKIGRAHV